MILFFFGLSAGAIAKIKGSSFFVWFLAGFVLPGLGTIAALLYRWERDEARRPCEQCGTELAHYVQVCPGCGYDQRFPELDEPAERAA